jgi:hypothetical protein
MKLYGGIDLHSNNSVIALLDETDNVVYQRRLPNDLTLMLAELDPISGGLPSAAGLAFIRLLAAHDPPRTGAVRTGGHHGVAPKPP